MEPEELLFSLKEKGEGISSQTDVEFVIENLHANGTTR